MKNNIANLVDALKQIVGSENVLWKPEDLLVYEYDGSIDRSPPAIVALPGSAEETGDCVRIAAQHKASISPRGAGTGLSGGAIPINGSVTIGMSRMNRILELDAENRFAIVEAGVVNAEISTAAKEHGLFYAPDPSSQRACTIGGNVAENAGGPHCLALGVTTNHVMGIETVLADGSLVWLGGVVRESPGFDLRGVLLGSEGMLGIVTKVAVRLLPIPESVKTLSASFANVRTACETVSEIIARGIVPSAVEIMDKTTLKACEPVYGQNHPDITEAVLIVEIDGKREAVEEETQKVIDICREKNVLEIRHAETEEERARLWAARKGAIGAFGVLAPSYYLVDGVVPRTRLPDAITKVQEIGAELGLIIGNVFHAGDGNLHPCILFDERDKEQTRLAVECGERILKMCLDYGGALTGEHGIGIEKQPYMPLVFTQDDMAAMQNVIAAFGSDTLLNHGKVFQDPSEDYDTSLKGYATRSTALGGMA